MRIISAKAPIRPPAMAPTGVFELELGEASAILVTVEVAVIVDGDVDPEEAPDTKSGTFGDGLALVVEVDDFEPVVELEVAVEELSFDCTCELEPSCTCP